MLIFFSDFCRIMSACHVDIGRYWSICVEKCRFLVICHVDIGRYWSIYVEKCRYQCRYMSIIVDICRICDVDIGRYMSIYVEKCRFLCRCMSIYIDICRIGDADVSRYMSIYVEDCRYSRWGGTSPCSSMASPGQGGGGRDVTNRTPTQIENYN